MRKKQKKIKTKFFASKIMVGIEIFGYLLCSTIWTGIFIAFLQGGNEITTKQDIAWIFAFITLIYIVYVIGSLFGQRNWFYVYELTSKGIKRKLFKYFRRNGIDWDEIHEMRCYEEGNTMLFLSMSRKMHHFWLIISKEELGEISLRQVFKRKDTICVYIDNAYTIKLIREYTDKEIINLPYWFENTNNG